MLKCFFTEKVTENKIHATAGSLIFMGKDIINWISLKVKKITG